MISPHWMPLHRGQYGPFSDRDVFARWNPPFLKLVWDGNRPPYLEDIPPNATIIWRNYPLSEQFHGGLDEGPSTRGAGGYAQDAQNGSGRDSYIEIPSVRSSLPTPEQAAAAYVENAVQVAEYCESRGIPRSRLLFEGPNEWPVWAHGYTGLARLETERLLLLHQHGLRGVWGNLGVGWPGNTGPDTPPVWDWAESIVRAMLPGDFLGLHEYWAFEGPEQNWGWWAGRCQKCPYNVPIIMTECGIDGGVLGAGTAKQGYLNLPGSSDDDKAERYFNELWHYAAMLDGRVRGLLVYTHDGNRDDWGQFDVRLEPVTRKLFAKINAVGLPVAKPFPVTPIEHPLSAALRAEFGTDYENISATLPKHPTLRYTKRPVSDIDRMVLHHTEAPKATTWQAVAQYHVTTNGWPGIAYHIGVRLAGGKVKVSLLNTPETRSYHAHTAGNDHGLAVCLAGSFTVASPTTEEIDVLRRVVRVVRAWSGLLPVVGHRDVPGNDTTCPGDGLAAAIPWLNTLDSMNSLIWSVAKVAQVISPNSASAIEIAMRGAGYTPIGNEMDVRQGSTWLGVAQLGYRPSDGDEVAFFATNLTADGQWTVRQVRRP